jgi:hypothetical protein
MDGAKVDYFRAGVFGIPRPLNIKDSDKDIDIMEFFPEEKAPYSLSGGITQEAAGLQNMFASIAPIPSIEGAEDISNIILSDFEGEYLIEKVIENYQDECLEKEISKNEKTKSIILLRLCCQAGIKSGEISIRGVWKIPLIFTDPKMISCINGMTLMITLESSSSKIIRSTVSFSERSMAIITSSTLNSLRILFKLL